MKVLIYGKSDCIYCDKALEACDYHGLAYSYKSVSHEVYLKELKEKLPDVKTVPQIWVDDKHIGGYTEFLTYIEEVSGGYGDGKL